jgi:hypothetical protein
MGTARRVARRLAEACGESVQAKRTRLGLGWSQCVLGHGARSVARGKARRWSVSSGEDADWAHARCSLICWSSERGR